MQSTVDCLLKEIKACQLCAKDLPNQPKPILQFSQQSRIIIAGQAPGKHTHLSGKPFDDASGVRLRQWLGLTEAAFYDEAKLAILPMGFCYPGSGKTGDLAPRPECAKNWRKPILDVLNNVAFTIVIGKYALAYHFPDDKRSLTQQIVDWEKRWPSTVVLPHPSPRNNIWLKKNPWFESEVLPRLRNHIAEILR